jgi:hypothetical protein
MMAKEKRGPPGALAAVGDVVRFLHGEKRLLRGRVASATENVVTVETKSGRLYGIFRSDVREIERRADANRAVRPVR